MSEKLGGGGRGAATGARGLPGQARARLVRWPKGRRPLAGTGATDHRVWAMKAHVAYEAAFEDFLRSRQVPYVAVDEAKRAAFRDARLKSFDFIVYSAQGPNWLVDIKGRRWAARKPGARPAWENWVTRGDLDGLRQWQDVFGAGFAGLLVFAYRLDEDRAPPAEVIHTFRGERYVFAGVPTDAYATEARTRSPKWDTVNMPTARFAEFVRPIAELL